MAQMVCDACEKEQLELFFYESDDLERFCEHNLLPRATSVMAQLFGAKGGKAFYIGGNGLAVTVVICNKCLVADKNEIFRQLIEKPKIIQRAIDDLGSFVADGEQRLSDQRKKLKSLLEAVRGLVKDMQEKRKSLAQWKDDINELGQKLNTSKNP